MALDTAAKRFSAIHVMSPWRGLGVFPTGTIDQAQRQGLAWLYIGILADAPIVIVGGQVWVWVNGTSLPPGQQAVGTQGHWLWIGGTVYIPPDPKRSPWPPRYSRSRRS